MNFARIPLEEYSDLHRSDNRNLSVQAVRPHRSDEIPGNTHIPFPVILLLRETRIGLYEQHFHKNRALPLPFSPRDTSHQGWEHDQKFRKPMLHPEMHDGHSPLHLPGHVCSGMCESDDW